MSLGLMAFGSLYASDNDDNGCKTTLPGDVSTVDQAPMTSKAMAVAKQTEEDARSAAALQAQEDARQMPQGALGSAAASATARPVSDNMAAILSARVGKGCVYFLENGEESSLDLTEIAKKDRRFALVNSWKDKNPLGASQLLSHLRGGKNVLPVQFTVHPVAEEMFALWSNMPQDSKCFIVMPPPRTDTYFVDSDAHGTQKKFIRERLEDPRVLEVSVFNPGNTMVFSSARYQHLCAQFEKTWEKMRPIELTEIKREALGGSFFVRYNCSRAGEQLVKSGPVSGLIHTTDVCDCLCICARSPSKNAGIMAHINHAALGNKATLMGFINALKALGNDLETTVVSSYLSAPIEKIMPFLNVISENVVVQCFPAVFERSEQGIRTIIDSKQLTFDQVLDTIGETSGGLTVLFNAQTGEIHTDITRISLAEKMRRAL